VILGCGGFSGQIHVVPGARDKMADTSSNHSNLQPCEMCSVIPSDLWANTGRGETLAPELGRLVRLDLDRSDDLYECPGCGALFEWQDLPQNYGSGNCDEERLTRLTPEQALTARALLDTNPEERDGEQLLTLAFQILSHDIVYNILRYTAVRHKQAFSGFVRPLVARLMAQSHGGLFDVISSYCDRNQERLTEVVCLLDAGGPDISRSAQYLRQTCMERLQRAN
jgi:hypothetical protein